MMHGNSNIKRSKDMFRISVIRCSTHQIFTHGVAGNECCVKDYTEQLQYFGKVIITRLLGNESELASSLKVSISKGCCNVKWTMLEHIHGSSFVMNSSLPKVK
jgi:hypothetical protein